MNSEGKLVIPYGGSSHFREVRVNRVPVNALRDTCASQTLVVAKPASPEQYLPGQICRVTQAHGQDFFHPMVLVSLEWEGVLAQRSHCQPPDGD